MANINKRILAVDDDPEILNVLYEMLKGFGYQVFTLGRADKLFEEIDAVKPDLILMDVMLSGMDGRNLCKAIKAEPKYQHIPTILISANVNAYNVMFEADAPNDFLAKPFDMEDLLRRVQTQLVA